MNQQDISRLLSRVSPQGRARVIDVLLKHPFWRAAVLEAHSLPQLLINYQPTVIEFFSQAGILCSRVGDRVFNFTVPEHEPDFIALYFDGELVVFVVGREVVVNRLALATTFALFDLGDK